MAATVARTFPPRKTPVQARSTASVEAILDATVQVLLAVGKEQLTTTRVAHRAGVSVGTLYQYFPNKSALLQAVLERHLNSIAAVIERVCREHHGFPAGEMVSALVHAFFAAKMKHPRTSVALYAVSADLDGFRITQIKGARGRAAIAAMLATAQPPTAGEPELVATLLYGSMVGISRLLVEGRHPEKNLAAIQQEFLCLASAYLRSKETA